MSTEKRHRKRSIASCSQCYAKKQKCNHQYPCNHCSRRRQPELCTYTSVPSSSGVGDGGSSSKRIDQSVCDSIHTSSENSGGTPASITAHRHYPSPATAVADTAQDGLRTTPTSPTHVQDQMCEASLPACFGYFEGSKSNLLGMMGEFDLLGNKEGPSIFDHNISQRSSPEIKARFQRFPKRSIMDYLIQNFFKEVNWIYEIIHGPAFLPRYENWWHSQPEIRFNSVEFGVLLLRICAYSAQFLPSRTYTADTISGVPLGRIRDHCQQLANDLTTLCDSLSESRSLTSVQHLFFAACYSKNEGRMKEAWFKLGTAIRLAQDLGMHMESGGPSSANLDDLEKEMRRRTFWNLYVWDRFLSMVLDRLPCIVDKDCHVEFPDMRFDAVSDDPDAPHVTMERILSSRLVQLWFSIKPPTPNQDPVYDPAQVEEQYERLCQEFVAQLPRAFAFENPNTQWDKKRPVLPRQRLMLRISVLVILCQLLRPLLLLSLPHIRAMPQYKCSLVLSHRRQLVNAATCLLDSVSALHELMGGNQTRYFLVSFYTFEPAMILGMHIMSAGMATETLRETRSSTSEPNCQLWSSPIAAFEAADSIHTDESSIARCRKYIGAACEKLEMLKEVNVIARAGVRELRHLIARLDNTNLTNQPREPNVLNECEHSDLTRTHQPHTAGRIDDTALLPLPDDGPVVEPWPDFSLNRADFLEDTLSVSQVGSAAYLEMDNLMEDPAHQSGAGSMHGNTLGLRYCASSYHNYT